MTTSTLIEHAIWFSTGSQSNDRICEIFSLLWAETWKYWNLPPIDGMSDNDAENEFSAEIERDPERLDEWTKGAWLRLGSGFYLLVTESHFSHGDICGTIRRNKLISNEDEVIAIPVALDNYIPTQGLLNPRASEQEIRKWREQAKNVLLVSRPRER